MILRKDTIAVVATMVVWVVCAQVDQALSQSPRLSAQSVGAGRWQSSRDHLGERDWQVQITRFEDDAIEGSLIVVGSPYLRQVRIEGRADGGEVYGVLLDQAGKQLGTFSGSVFNDAVSGTYTTAHGDTGSWSWPGPAGARSLKAADPTR